MKLETEMSDFLYEKMNEFITSNPKWSRDNVISSSLTNFLVQNGCKDEEVKEKFLKDLF